MRCYNCNAELTEREFCTVCGANVSAYKKIIRTSNAYYNDGLARARVRDLSGAAESLRRSVKYNKNNITARNLLGLVYYEMGDTFHALSEWVISHSLQEKENDADRYLQEIRGSAGVLERAKQAIKKYNLAVNYAKTNSEDLAVIQLRRVLSLNGKMLCAHQLLALLYMKNGDYTKAKKVLRKAQQIDTNNTTTLKYLREVDRLYAANKGNPEHLRSSGTNRDRVTYQSGNDTVIQPASFKESSGLWTVAYLAVGIVIGLLAAWFLILPSRESAIRDEYKKKEQALYASLQGTEAPQVTKAPEETKAPDESAKPEETKAPEKTKEPSESKAPEKTEEPSESKAPQKTEAPDASDDLDEEIYGNTDDMQIDSSMSAEDYFKRGSDWYDYGDYEDAVSNLQKALALDDEHLMSLYYLGRAYQKLDENSKAISVYERIIALYPDNELADDARRFIGELQ